MTAWLHTQGYGVDRRRVRRLLGLMGLETIYPKPRLSQAGEQIVRYPYLLRNVIIERINQVWSSDITYIRLARGFVYFTAIIDWFSRYVLAWELSTTMDSSFCLEALDRALRLARPEIFNTDQGVQFTSKDWISCLQQTGIRISGIGADVHWTTFSSNACGAVSSTKRFISKTIKRCQRQGKDDSGKFLQLSEGISSLPFSFVDH